VDLTDAPSTQSFTEQHGIVHSTPALNPTSEQPITTPSGERQIHWAPQEQLDVMARSLINAKAESEALKRKCAKLQQTMNQLRGQSSLQPAEEGELSRSASRSHQKGQSRFMDAEPGLYTLPSGSNEVGAPIVFKSVIDQYYRPQEISPFYQIRKDNTPQGIILVSRPAVQTRLSAPSLWSNG